VWEPSSGIPVFSLVGCALVFSVHLSRNLGPAKTALAFVAGCVCVLVFAVRELFPEQVASVKTAFLKAVSSRMS
jgi:hypothetical protein